MGKKIIAYAVILTLVFSSFVVVWAEDDKDYRSKRFYKIINGIPSDVIEKPTAQFSVTYKGATTESYDGIDDTKIDSNLNVVTVNLGDKISIADLSHSNRGKTLKAWDFQITRPDGTYSLINNQSFVGEYTMSQVGKYTFSLCVRDNIENEAWTNYWGNWSENGNHRVVGNNPGQDINDPSDDFNGYWYFTRIVVKVVKNPPTADFSIEYRGDDVTDNKTSPATIDPGALGLVLQDKSTPFSSAEPITERKWFYWDVNSGWKEISGSKNKTTANISNMDTGLPGSGINKAFKLDVKSSTGGADDESHTAYFKKVLTSGYIVYYRDQDTGRDIYPVKEMPGLGFGTYIETARPAPEKGTLVTPSPATIILNAANPFVEFTFYYKFTTQPSDPEPSAYPPTAILNSPKEVMAGDAVKADGSQSRSNNPGGHIEEYYFEYDGANLIKDNCSDVRIWYPETGTYTICLDVEDEEGSIDRAEKEIKVKPPVPTAVITVTGKLKENRRVTIDSSGSTSPTYYPIDNTKIIWTVTPVSGGTAADIKYAGSLAGSASKDILFKKAGTYRITLTVYNTKGYSASATQTITIAQDLPPVAKLYLPAPAGSTYKVYRNPASSNYATFEIFNQSYSPDGDTIDKAVMLYCYDSDNDGNYMDEQWYYSKDGTTWISTCMNYVGTVSSFNIYSIAAGNISRFTLKTKEVGRYHFAVRVMETIPAAETIPAFITENDYKRDDDF